MRWLICLLVFTKLYGDDPEDVYRKIQDIYHPTVNDYRLIQDYLTNGERPLLYRLENYAQKARDFKIIGDALPQSKVIAVNSCKMVRENCILLYSSYNFDYQKGLKRIIEILVKSDYKGHILYYIGGWPNVEGGSLLLAHVPYAFKVAAFKEAERLGYKRAFWLDASVIPLVSMNQIFAIMVKSSTLYNF
jgi:hypothetical protein